MGRSNEPNSDAELLNHFARTQSNEAFTKIVRRHVDLVYSTALRRVGDRHLAEDVTQAVFFVLAKKAGRIPGSTILAGWLYRTARFISADAMKMKMRREHHEQAAAVLREETSGDTTWPKISPLLESALDGLGTRDRDVILLRFFEGMEIAEIAIAAGIPANTVSKRLQRALERLRKFFTDRGIATPAATIGTAIVAAAACHAPESLAASCAAQATAGSPGIVLLASRAMGSGLVWMKAIAVLILSFGLMGTAVIYLATSAPSPSTRPAANPPIRSSAVAPALVRSLEPVSDQQQRQIRAEIYVIRHNTDEPTSGWMDAIRTLVQIGRPAVPDLVAELDRTSAQLTTVGLDTGAGDKALRELGFTLRAIGDPRACPALIRAIQRTAVMTSDISFTPAIFHIPPDLVAFMQQYEIGHDPRFVSIARSIREICGALEVITHHQEGRPAFIDASAFNQTEFDKAKHRHEALGRQWQQWWDQHHAEIVSDADMKTLTTHPHTDADIEAAAGDVDESKFATTQNSR